MSSPSSSHSTSFPQGLDLHTLALSLKTALDALAPFVSAPITYTAPGKKHARYTCQRPTVKSARKNFLDTTKQRLYAIN